MPAFTFKPLQVQDILMVYQWHQAPHVHQWWDLPASYEAFASQCRMRITGEHPVHPFVIYIDQKAIGYIQYFSIASWPEYQACLAIAEPSAGVDMFIGESTYVHRGFGGPILASFLVQQVFTDFAFTHCLVGPDPANSGAIRAYEKVGFRYWQTVFFPFLDEEQYLMTVTPTDLPTNSFRLQTDSSQTP